MEHDQVFWTSDREGRILLFKIICASILLGCALAKEFRGCRWLREEGVKISETSNCNDQTSSLNS